MRFLTLILGLRTSGRSEPILTRDRIYFFCLRITWRSNNVWTFSIVVVMDRRMLAKYQIVLTDEHFVADLQ